MFLSRDAFVGMNRRAIAMMFVCLSVRDRRALWSYGARFADLILWLNSPMFLDTLTLKHVHLLSAVFFQFHLEERWDMDVQK